MNYMKKIRIKQILKYGWQDSLSIQKQSGRHRILVFLDILKTFKNYYVFSNQYKNNRLWSLNSNDFVEKAQVVGQANLKHDNWWVNYYDNRKWLNKWMKYEWETSPEKSRKRAQAYMKRFNIGDGLLVQYNVDLSQEHGLYGSISIGEDVLLAKNVFIDYSGEVVIKDHVKIAAGVSIESHHRDIDAYNSGKDINIPTKIVIEEGAYIGTHATILDSCNYIGKHARIGAGAVVVKDIPDYAVAVGIPAKVVKIIEHH